jgi:hypothetical protein
MCYSTMECRKQCLDQKAMAVTPTDSIELHIPDEESHSGDIRMADSTGFMSGIGEEVRHD